MSSVVKWIFEDAQLFCHRAFFLCPRTIIRLPSSISSFAFHGRTNFERKSMVVSQSCEKERSISRRKQRPYRRCSCLKRGCPGNSKRQNMMVTHVAADGKTMPLHLQRSSSSSSSLHDAPKCDLLIKSEPAEDDLSSIDGNDNTEKTSKVNLKSYVIRKTMKYTLVSLVVFLGQIAVSVTLKRYGVIEKDFNEMVAERVLPHLQSGLEQTALFMPQFNESLDWLRSFNQSLPSMNYMTQASLRPGYQLAQKGAKAKHPVIMIPGFVTSALEVWEGKQCGKQLFRQRVWGGVGMVQHWLMERQCVMEHMALDPMTGGDPEGIRVRAASGFESADYFAGNYWVWSKLLENLADIGYDGNMMSMESWDWRLSFPMLEERDGYLTKLQYRIESFHKTSGQKVVITSHSLGCVLVHYFMVWVTTPAKHGGGGGGKDWVEKHIESYINIAGAQLGAPKSASSLLSGEMADTVVLGAVGTLIEQFYGRKIRKDLWNTWGSLWALLPKGGDALWNTGADLQAHGLSGKAKEIAPSDRDDFEDHFMILTDEDLTEDQRASRDNKAQIDDVVDEPVVDPAVIEAVKGFSYRGRQTMNDVIDFLSQWGAGKGPETANARFHSFNHKERPSRSTWHDLTRTPLPSAPNMKIYCLYGVGLDTERAYYYKRNRGESGSVNHSQSKSHMIDPPFILDTSKEDALNNVRHGVKFVDGDGSVPLLSLGYMCADGWRRKETGLNPGGTKVVTREYKHKSEILFDDPIRGGPYSADHVDVMGNLFMMDDFLKIVSGFEFDTVEDQFQSDILAIAENINKHPTGGLKKKRKRWIF